MTSSEYRKKYRPIGTKAIESHYAQLLAYRRSRRFNEFSHHQWAWNGVDDSESSETAEELPQDEVKMRPDYQPRVEENGTRSGEESSEESNDSDIEERLKRLAVKKALQKVNVKKSSEARRAKRPRNPKNRTPIPKPVRSKSPSRKAIGDEILEIQPDKPLFVPYGIGNRTGAATFNVRSDRDVCPSALRAKRRRQIEIEKRAAEKLVKPARQKRKEASSLQFEDKMRRETTKWASEYANQYPTYEAAHYRRSLANLTPRPTSAF